MRAKDFIVEGWKDWFKGNKIDPALQRYQQIHPEPVVKQYSHEEYEANMKKLGDIYMPVKRMIATLNSIKNSYPADIIGNVQRIFYQSTKDSQSFDYNQKLNQLNRKYKLHPGEVYDWDQDEVDLGDPDEVEYKQAVIDMYGEPSDYEDNFDSAQSGNYLKDLYNLNKQQLAYNIKREQEFYKKLQELGIQLK